jgi:hypothetical protein
MRGGSLLELIPEKVMAQQVHPTYSYVITKVQVQCYGQQLPLKP